MIKMEKIYACRICKICNSATGSPDKCKNRITRIDYLIQYAKEMVEEAEDGWSSGMQKVDTDFMLSELQILKDEIDD